MTYVIERKGHGYVSDDQFHTVKEKEHAKTFSSREHGERFLDLYWQDAPTSWKIVPVQKETKKTEQYVIWVGNTGYLGRSHFTSKPLSRYDFTDDIWLAISFKTKECAKDWITEHKENLSRLSKEGDIRIEKVTKTITLTVESGG